ncbi:MAG: hypothetical protein RLY16_10 [Bacteroidota bacterium]|jgi:gliding motility-associated lipoprotein GldD
MTKKVMFVWVGLFVALAFAACNAPYVSKKRGYYAIQFPAHQYRLLDDPSLPYTFEYPVYANVVQDSTYFDNNPENSMWRNIDFPQFHGKIFLSYKEVGGKALYKLKKENGTYKDTLMVNVFDRMVTDAFTLTNKNDVVANSIKDSLIRTENGVSGVFFKVGGNAATAKQFFLSDTTKHFLRGALYFDVTPNADSLKPVHDFLQVDMDHMIQTFRWKAVGSNK